MGQKNWISGARHVLKLVDGSLGNVPVRIDNGKGGFTVGSENPVYIQGDYNSSVADPTWTNPAAADPPHAAAAVIADAVTLLSSYDPASGQGWVDLNSLRSPSNDGGRQAFTSYYRVAVSGGKNINFPVNVCCAWSGTDDWGTDGGVHNFLRQLENWGGDTRTTRDLWSACTSPLMPLARTRMVGVRPTSLRLKLLLRSVVHAAAKPAARNTAVPRHRQLELPAKLHTAHRLLLNEPAVQPAPILPGRVGAFHM